MKQIVPIVLTALMMASLFAGIDFVDELKDTNEMETSGRAAYELNLHDVLQPRETFVDAGGNTRNGIDIGDEVFFRPIIIADGDNAQDEFSIRVTVTPAGDGQTAVIDHTDTAVCIGDPAQTGCSFNTLAAGEFLGGGNYRVQDGAGGDLSWSPTIAGEYWVNIEIVEIAEGQDMDLTNNDMTYKVVVQHYTDIVVDLCWTVTVNGDCKESPADKAGVQGTGPHEFMLTVTADGSEDWSPRDTTFSVEFAGDLDTQQTRMQMGDGNYVNVATGGMTMTLVAGETMPVDVWHNVTEVNNTVTDSNDIQENPCSNGASSNNNSNPCQDDRTVLDFQTTYTYRGTIVGNEASENDMGLFSVTVRLATFDLYAPKEGAAGGVGPGGGEQENNAVIMEEKQTDYDDRTGNNDGELMGSFSVFHDIGVTALTGGPNEATEGTLNVGMTTLRANVVYGGSSATNQYDWRVIFTVVDENDVDALNGAPGIADSCEAASHAQQTNDYTHKPLSQTAGGTAPEGTACLDVMLNAGRFTVTATVELLNGIPSTVPENATDMNSGNDVRATTFEVINDIPTVYMTLDEISRDGESVEAPVIVGDSITMRARGQDTEDDAANMPLMTEWTRIDNSGEMMMLDTCMGEICSVETDASWIGTARITATVTDSNGAATSDVLEISVWNHYTNDMTLTDATLSYSLVFSGLTPLDVNATDGTAQDLQQLGENMGAYNSTVSFEMTTSHIFGHQDIGTESLTIAFDGNPAAPWGLWYKRTTDSAWENVAGAVASAGDNGGVVMTYTHDGGLMGSLNGGTYAIFDVASEEAAPPATGIGTITATPMPSSQVMIDWTYEDDSLLGNSDLVAIYTCKGVDCTVDMSEPVVTTVPTLTNWKLVGDDGETYTVLVQTENGNGPDKTGGAKSVTITADGAVTPPPTIDGADASAEDNGLTFTWTATNTDDVEQWMVCWAASQAVVQDSFSSLLADSCAETEDTTTSLTVTEQDMCSGECNTNMFFAIGAKDATGNVYSPSEGVDHLMTVDYTSGVADPGVIDGGSDPAGGDEGMPSTAIAAIIVLVVVAVIGGAFILTRGAEGDGEDKEWDY